jgi:hypothetical protein
MSTQKVIRSQADVISVCQSRIKGIQMYAPASGTISCAGMALTAVQLVARYQACIDTRQALDVLRNEEEVAMKARDAADTARKAVDAGVIQWAVNTFGPESQQAKDIGFVPRDPTPPTVEVKAAAAAKAKATRAARGTTGKKAKKAITGATVTTAASTVTAVAAPAAAPSAVPSTPGVTKG